MLVLHQRSRLDGRALWRLGDDKTGWSRVVFLFFALDYNEREKQMPCVTLLICVFSIFAANFCFFLASFIVFASGFWMCFSPLSYLYRQIWMNTTNAKLASEIAPMDTKVEAIASEPLLH